MGGVDSTLTWKMPDVPADETRKQWNDLSRFDIVGSFRSGTMTAQGAGNLSGRLTPYGQQFVHLLRLEAGYAA